MTRRSPMHEERAGHGANDFSWASPVAWCRFSCDPVGELKALGWVIVGSDSAKNHVKGPTMTHHQSALSHHLQELLDDPSLAHEEFFWRLLQVGLRDLSDTEAASKIGACRERRGRDRRDDRRSSG